VGTATDVGSAGDFALKEDVLAEIAGHGGIFRAGGRASQSIGYRIGRPAGRSGKRSPKMPCRQGPAVTGVARTGHCIRDSASAGYTHCPMNPTADPATPPKAPLPQKPLPSAEPPGSGSTAPSCGDDKVGSSATAVNALSTWEWLSFNAAHAAATALLKLLGIRGLYRFARAR
jgi:hypothetical protein